MSFNVYRWCFIFTDSRLNRGSNGCTHCNTLIGIDFCGWIFPKMSLTLRTIGMRVEPPTSRMVSMSSVLKRCDTHRFEQLFFTALQEICRDGFKVVSCDFQSERFILMLKRKGDLWTLNSAILALTQRSRSSWVAKTSSKMLIPCCF